MAAVVSGLARADDAVSIRRVVCRGISELAARRQLAEVATPRVRPFVFVRRVRLRGAAGQVGRTMEAALARLADDQRGEVVTFTDFPALAAACARAALDGCLGSGWHWRALGLTAAARPGEAIAALLAAYPLEAGSAVAALADAGLLGPVWRTLSETAAAHLAARLADAAGLAVASRTSIEAAGSEPLTAPALRLVEQAASLWAPALPMTSRPQAAIAAAVLSLLRWSPSALRDPDTPVWPALLARLEGRSQPSQASSADPPPGMRGNAPERPRPTAFDDGGGPHPANAERHGEEISTGWGGVLFLINALERLDIGAALAKQGSEGPSSWRLLHDLGVALGMPADEPLAQFLAAQDYETVTPPQQLAALLTDIESLYRPNGPWPLPLEQPARLWATETHLDLHLAAAEVDVELRLSGLDFDPGWVPWLGRVVAFHYDRMPTRHRRGG